MNILLLSVGTRNKIVQYFKNECKGKGNVIATDCSKLAPALYEADKHYIVPEITTNGYVDRILNICEKEEIGGVLSLIDPEISIIAKAKNRFEEIGVKVISPAYEVCERTLNKWEFYNWLSGHGYKCAKTYIEKDIFYDAVDSGDIHYPVFIKPILGSASINITKAYDNEMVDLLFKNFKGLMIQEFMDGTELGADVYVDLLSNQPISIFVKEKIKMRAGETDKAVSLKDGVLFTLIQKFVCEMRLTGIIDIDIFKVDGNYYISEVNPRFGGGYPHAYECGMNVPKLILNNLYGILNDEQIGRYDAGVYMLKYNEMSILRN